MTIENVPFFKDIGFGQRNFGATCVFEPPLLDITKGLFELFII
jgi:hypothetical protein